MIFFNNIVDKRPIRIYNDFISHYRLIKKRGLIMSKKIENVNDLLNGINVIANVLLIGKSGNIEEISENPNAVDLYASLVEITEQYASVLVAKSGQFELRHEERKDTILKAVNGL